MKKLFYKFWFGSAGLLFIMGAVYSWPVFILFPDLGKSEAAMWVIGVVHLCVFILWMYSQKFAKEKLNSVGLPYSD